MKENNRQVLQILTPNFSKYKALKKNAYYYLVNKLLLELTIFCPCQNKSEIILRSTFCCSHSKSFECRRRSYLHIKKLIKGSINFLPTKVPACKNYINWFSVVSRQVDGKKVL